MKPDQIQQNGRNLLLYLILTFCLCTMSLGQNRKDSIPISKNTLYVEFFGNCIYGSINYDRIVVHKNKISLRFGFLPYPKVTSLASATFEINYINGIKHNLEYSLGIIYVHGLSRQGQTGYYTHIATGNLFLFPHFGYRFQKPEGGLFLKVGIGANLKIGELYQYDYKKYGGGFLEINSGVNL